MEEEGEIVCLAIVQVAEKDGIFNNLRPVFKNEGDDAGILILYWKRREDRGSGSTQYLPLVVDYKDQYTELKAVD